MVQLGALAFIDGFRLRQLCGQFGDIIVTSICVIFNAESRYSVNCAFIDVAGIWDL